MKRAVFLTVILTGWWLPAIFGQQVQNSATDLLAAQQADLSAQEAAAGVYEVAIDYSYRLANGEQYGKKTNYVVTRKPGHIRVQTDDARMVFCSNPTYMFVAAKPKPGGYVLAQYRSGTEYGPESVRDNEFNRYVRDYHLVCRPLTECIVESYPEVVRAGKIQVVAIDRTADGVRVRYTRTRPDPTGRPTVPVSGTMTFDTDGRLTRLSERSAGSWKMDKVRTHAATLPSGSKFTDSQTLDIFADGVASVTRTTFKPQPELPAGDHEFYLSHYGLPEPIGGVVAPAGPVPLWWWFAGAALLALLTVACRRLARRRAGPGIASPPTGA